MSLGPTEKQRRRCNSLCPAATTGQTVLWNRGTRLLLVEAVLQYTALYMRACYGSPAVRSAFRREKSSRSYVMIGTPHTQCRMQLSSESSAIVAIFWWRVLRVEPSLRCVT